MELEDFVRITIFQICKGVSSAIDECKDLGAKKSRENIPIVYRRYLKSNKYVIKWNYPDGSHGFVTEHFSKLHK